MKKENTFTIEEENVTKTYLPCDCGCSIIEIVDWKDMDESFLVIYVSAFGEKQSPIKHNIKERLKMIWAAIRGKNYRLYDLTISKKQFREFLHEYLDKAEKK